MKTYEKGDDFQVKSCDLKTFGITEVIPINSNCKGEVHTNKIEVFGDEELRDTILSFLNNGYSEDLRYPEFEKSDNPISNELSLEQIEEPVGDNEEAPTNYKPDYEAVQKDFTDVINRHSLENESNTPDFILAEYLVMCLRAFTISSRARERWYGKELKI